MTFEQITKPVIGNVDKVIGNVDKVFGNIDKVIRNVDKHNAELQRTDPGTKVTGEFSTRGHIFSPNV